VGQGEGGGRGGGGRGGEREGGRGGGPLKGNIQKGLGEAKNVVEKEPVATVLGCPQ